MWTQLPPEKKGTPTLPNFGSCLLWPNGWMDEDAAWYGSRPQPGPHCTMRGPCSHERDTAAPLFSARVCCGHGRPSQLLLSSCLHRLQQSVPILYSGTPPAPLKIAPSHWGSGPPSDTWFPGPTRVLNPNGISKGSVIFAGLTSVTDRDSLVFTMSHFSGFIHTCKQIVPCHLWWFHISHGSHCLFCATRIGSWSSSIHFV